MRHYETTYILRPNLGEDQCTEIIDRTNAIVTNDGGAIICLDRWGVKRLAYEINREIQGYYVYMNYAAPGKTVDEIERIFRIDDRVLRYLTVKLGDNMNAEAIEAEKQHIAEKAAARAKAQSENSEGDDFDGEPLEEEATEE
ncbi:30S ribosomal protein S6 [Desulfobulbus sp.]|uniref:30S ribosomal protein S6 n=1 Tax=Desulfobulbus sp. TaxID=895 RepID=UPI00286EB7C7|nr:30S ribosomal protein S6 [Desulfobulbus sp.]